MIVSPIPEECPKLHYVSIQGRSGVGTILEDPLNVGGYALEGNSFFWNISFPSRTLHLSTLNLSMDATIPGVEARS